MKPGYFMLMRHKMHVQLKYFDRTKLKQDKNRIFEQQKNICFSKCINNISYDILTYLNNIMGATKKHLFVRKSLFYFQSLPIESCIQF